MKEQRITIDIDAQGRLTADADGFEGDVCMQDLERLLDGLSAPRNSVQRKPARPVQLSQQAVQSIGRKGGPK